MQNVNVKRVDNSLPSVVVAVVVIRIFNFSQPNRDAFIQT